MTSIQTFRAARTAAFWTSTALLAALFAVPASAQVTPEQPPQRLIRVSGIGEVRAAPDVAHLDFAVETFAQTARVAGEENARLMDRVIRALTAAGLPREEIQTRGYSLFPEYAQPDRPPTPREAEQPQHPRIIGYRAMNMVSVQTRDLERVGQIIDTALGAGANRMDALRFSLRDAEAAQTQALQQATARARRSAEAIAAALGVRLGAIMEASTATGLIGAPVQYDMAVSARAEMAPPTPIQPGEQSVTAMISLAFAIDG